MQTIKKNKEDFTIIEIGYSESEKKMLSKNKKDFTTVLGYSESEKKLSDLHGESYIKYRQEFKKAQDLQFNSEYPLQLDFELNYSCNLSCDMCTWATESKRNRGKVTWFDFEEYKNIIDKGVENGLKAVRLNYINEPLIRRDISHFIRYAKDAGIVEVYMSTNGMLLTKDFAIKLIESGLTKIQISIDATNSETFDLIRQGGDYNKVVSNTKRFIDIRNKTGTIEPQVRVNFVKTDVNIHQLDDFINEWDGVADLIGIQDLVGIMDKYKNKNHDDGIHRKFNCTQPFYHMTIRYDGTVLPCCSFFGAELPIAKISKDNPKDINEIWNSDEINFLRKIHAKGEYWKHPVCKRCINSTSHVD